jgi:hypothetical protein
LIFERDIQAAIAGESLELQAKWAPSEMGSKPIPHEKTVSELIWSKQDQGID